VSTNILASYSLLLLLQSEDSQMYNPRVKNGMGPFSNILTYYWWTPPYWPACLLLLLRSEDSQIYNLQTKNAMGHFSSILSLWTPPYTPLFELAAKSCLLAPHCQFLRDFGNNILSPTHNTTRHVPLVYILLSLASIQIATDKLAETHFAENKRIAIENVPCS
jgi:hypothetical protein